MSEERMKVAISIKRVPKNKDIFELTVATSVLRSQFRLPRGALNNLRILIEKALMSK